MNKSLRALKNKYKRRKSEIENRLKEFGAIPGKGKETVFGELCFCLLTANANALKCAEAIKDLKACNLISKGSIAKLWPKLRGRVRFHNNKARYIVEARGKIGEDSIFNEYVSGKMGPAPVFREWLVENIKGLGYKEASHFLRNIGLGKDIAILDRHILKNLKKYGVIKKIPDSLPKKTYLDIEKKMRLFSKKAGIPLDSLDLLFWSIQTGFVFK